MTAGKSTAAVICGKLFPQTTTRPYGGLAVVGSWVCESDWRVGQRAIVAVSANQLEGIEEERVAGGQLGGQNG